MYFQKKRVIAMLLAGGQGSRLHVLTRKAHRLGLPTAGDYEPVFCSDDVKYGGTGDSPVTVRAEEVAFREYKHSGLFHIPPMSITIYKKIPQRRKKSK